MIRDEVGLAEVRSTVVHDRLHLQVPSQVDWIAPTLEMLRQRLLLVTACDETQLQRLIMGLHEGLTNAIVHGNLEVPSALKEDGNEFVEKLIKRQCDSTYGGRMVHLDLDYNGQRWQWTISDEGPGFDHEEQVRRIEEDPTNGYLASGRGILMMRAFFDEVRWENQGRRLILTWYPSAEHRHEPRLPVQTRIKVAPIRGDGSVDWSAAEEAITRNLSQGGALLLHQSLAQAERVMLTLDVDGQSLHLPAQVRHWTPLEEGLVEIGCAFQIEKADSEPDAQKRVQEALDDLLEGLEQNQKPSDERRESARVPFSQRVELLGDSTQPTVVGFTQNLSRGGVKLFTTQVVPLEERTLVLTGVEAHPLRMRVQIVRCNQLTERLFDVAACFLDVE